MRFTHRSGAAAEVGRSRTDYPSVWDYLLGCHEIREDSGLATQPFLGLTTTILTEVLQGFRDVLEKHLGLQVVQA